MSGLPSLDTLSKACPQLPPVWTALSRLLDASSLLAQALGPLFGRLVTAIGPFVPPFLCLPTLCLGKWESQYVCCVNTSWNPVIEIAEGARPHLPASQPLPGCNQGGLASGQPQTYDPSPTGLPGQG